MPSPHASLLALNTHHRQTLLCTQRYFHGTWAVARWVPRHHGIRIVRYSVVMRTRPDVFFERPLDFTRASDYFRRGPRGRHLVLGQEWNNLQGDILMTTVSLIRCHHACIIVRFPPFPSTVFSPSPPPPPAPAELVRIRNGHCARIRRVAAAAPERGGVRRALLPHTCSHEWMGLRPVDLESCAVGGNGGAAGGVRVSGQLDHLR